MRKKHEKHIRKEVKRVYSQIAQEFDQTRKYPWREFEHFLSYLKKGDKVLDLGCGNGRLFEVLKKKEVRYIGVDNSEALILKAKENFPEARFEVGDMLKLDLKSGTYDALFSIAAFHHLPGRETREKAEREMHRVLKKDGILVLTVWNLFQRKYLFNVISAFLSFIFTLGFRYAWNDLWIKWKRPDMKRYYHAFLPRELRSYFKNGWEIEEFYFVKKGTRVQFFQSFNLVLIARKK